MKTEKKLLRKKKNGKKKKYNVIKVVEEVDYQKELQ